MARYCRYCGTELSDQAVFCKGCGRQLPKAEPERTGAYGTEDEGTVKRAPAFCRYCGGQITPGAAFCKSCGKRLDLAAASMQPPSRREQRRIRQGTGQEDGGRSVSRESWSQRDARVPQNPQSPAKPRRSPVKPAIAAVLVLALFVSFVYPGFVRTRLFGGSEGTEGSGAGNNSGISALLGGGNEAQGNAAVQEAELLPSPEELEAEYAAIDAAYANGTLFADADTVKEDPHAQYPWLYGDESGWDVPDESEDAQPQQPKILPEGNSKAFRTETPYGITVSAEKGMLDKDREFKVEPITPEQYDALDAALSEAEGSGSMIVGAWDLDAGMEDHEILPGDYKLEIDLEELGLDGEDYESLHFYRVDDAGKWYEYQSECSGNIVSIEANQNSIIVTTLATLAIALPLYDAYMANQGGAYFNPFTGTFDLKYQGKAVMTVMLDRKSFLNDLQVANEAHFSDLEEAAKNEVFLQIKKEEDLDFKDYREMNKAFQKEWMQDPDLAGPARRIFKSFVKRYEKLTKEKIEQDPDYNRIKRNLEDFKNSPLNISDGRTELEAVEKTCEAALRAWQWLKEDQGLRMPNYKFRLELSSMDKAYGATQTPILGNPYMVISMAQIGRGSRLAYDRLLLTVCHELFHAVQRVYVSYALGTYKFDEMTAQDLEGIAYDHFREAEDNPITSSREAALENLREAYWLAVPLNDFDTSYPEGKLNGSNDRASSSYPTAPVVTWLRENGGQKYPDILSKYHGLWGKRAVTTILKEAFSLDETGLTEAYHKFAESYQTTLYKEALKPKVNEVFAPLARITGSDGRLEVQLLNKNYTIRVRRVRPEKRQEKASEYALVLKYKEDFKDTMSDFTITPLNKKKDTHYREYADGLFFEPKEWGAEETVYLMEADGGTAAASEGWIWNDYSGYYLYLMVKPDQPEAEKKGEVLELKLPELGEEPKKEIIDSYVVTLRTGKTDVLQQQVTREDLKQADGKPVKIDISNLKIKGQKLTDEEKKNLVVILQECVEGTYETKKPCLGPESDPVPIENDIYGTWEMISDIQDYKSPMLGGLVDQQAKTIGGLSLGPGDPQEAKQQVKDYRDQYYQKENEIANSVSKGTMIIRPTMKIDVVEASIKYPDAPEELYEGTYDKKTKLLKLERKDTTYSFEGSTDNAENNAAHQKIESGTYDLKDFGLAPGLDLQIAEGPDPKDPSKQIMTFTGELNINNQFIILKTKLSGTKLSDEY